MCTRTCATLGCNSHNAAPRRPTNVGTISFLYLLIGIEPKNHRKGVGREQKNWREKKDTQNDADFSSRGFRCRLFRASPTSGRFVHESKLTDASSLCRHTAHNRRFNQRTRFQILLACENCPSAKLGPKLSPEQKRSLCRRRRSSRSFRSDLQAVGIHRVSGPKVSTA